MRRGPWATKGVRREHTHPSAWLMSIVVSPSCETHLLTLVMSALPESYLRSDVMKRR